jgi:hypothetical protein
LGGPAEEWKNARDEEKEAGREQEEMRLLFVVLDVMMMMMNRETVDEGGDFGPSLYTFQTT